MMMYWRVMVRRKYSMNCTEGLLFLRSVKYIPELGRVRLGWHNNFKRNSKSVLFLGQSGTKNENA